MPQQLLDGADVMARLEQVGGERVPERVVCGSQRIGAVADCESERRPTRGSVGAESRGKVAVTLEKGNARTLPVERVFERPREEADV